MALSLYLREQQRQRDKAAAMQPQNNNTPDPSVTATGGMAAGTTPSGQQQIVMPTVDTTNAIGSLADLLGPTPAEREAQERRLMENKAKMQMWTGLFDGLRQLGNLYYASKGATPQQFNNPYQMVEQQYQQQRQLANEQNAYQRQYANTLYTLQRQADADQRAKETHKAQLEWYKNRDEQNAEKVAIQRFKAEADAAYKEASLEEKKRMNDIMADVYAGRISLMEAQEQLAKVRAAHIGAGGSGGGGRNNGTYGYRTTSYIDEQGRKITERVPTTGGKPETRVGESKKTRNKSNKQKSGKKNRLGL